MYFSYHNTRNSDYKNGVIYCKACVLLTCTVAIEVGDALHCNKAKKNGKAIPVTGREGPYGCESSRLPHFL
jgi:hypothetical protein